MKEEVYLAGGCLWGVQEFLKHVPGVVDTEAGRANGSSDGLSGEYDGYAECVRTVFDPERLSLEALLVCFFEIIDPTNVNRQGGDVGPKYRTGIYSRDPEHLAVARGWIARRPDRDRIVVEVLPLTRFVPSAGAHQHRLSRIPEDLAKCHLPVKLLHKYKNAG